MRIARLLFAAVIAVLPVSAQSVTVQLQRAIFLEETAGDLDAAIQIYRKILASGADARAYEAEAQYRLGACLLKKGDKPLAARTFQQLIQKHPEATNLVAQGSTHFQDSEVGYSLTVPLGWTVVSRRPSQGPGTCVNIDPPERDAIVAICAKPDRSAANGIDARMAQGEAAFVERYRERFPDFLLRPNNPVTGTLAGQHTLSVIGDYAVPASQNNGLGVRETVWTTWVQTEATRSSVIVRARSDNFDDFRVRVAAILNSFRLP